MDVVRVFDELRELIRDRLGELALEIADKKSSGRASEVEHAEDALRRLSNLSVVLKQAAAECAALLTDKPSRTIPPRHASVPPTPPPMSLSEGSDNATLTLGKLRGLGHNQTEQMIWLLKQVGLKKACRLCREYGILANKKKGCHLVSRHLQTEAKYVHWEVEDGETYYIYTNLNRHQKQALLDELACLIR